MLFLFFELSPEIIRKKQFVPVSMLFKRISDLIRYILRVHFVLSLKKHHISQTIFPIRHAVSVPDYEYKYNCCDCNYFYIF